MARTIERPAAAAGVSAERVSGRAIAIFAVVSVALLMASIDSTIVAVGLPQMMNGLNTNLVWIAGPSPATRLTQTVMMPMAGKLCDDFGPQDAVSGLRGAFHLARALRARAQRLPADCLSRATGHWRRRLSAVGAPASSATFRPRVAARRIGLFTSVFPLGGIIGPNLGGWMIDHFVARSSPSTSRSAWRSSGAGHCLLLPKARREPRASAVRPGRRGGSSPVRHHRTDLPP